MTGNGADAYAALSARVAELEAAHALLVRRWDAELVPRLVDIDADLDHLARAIVRALGARAADEPARPASAQGVTAPSSVAATGDGARGASQAPPETRPSSVPTIERPATNGQRE